MYAAGFVCVRCNFVELTFINALVNKSVYDRLFQF